MAKVLAMPASALKAKIPSYPPLAKGGDYEALLLKSPFEKGGLGDLRIGKWDEFMADGRSRKEFRGDGFRDAAGSGLEGR